MATIPKSLGQPSRPYMLGGYSDPSPAKSSTTPAPYPGMLAPKASTSNLGVPAIASTAATSYSAPSVPMPKAISKATQDYTDALGQYKQQIATPFSYDPSKDTQAQAYKSFYDRQAKDASRNAMEALNSRGILNSSITAGEVADAEQNAGLQYGMKVADLGAQAYQRNQDNLSNQSRLIGLLGNQQQYENQNQQFDKTYGLQRDQYDLQKQGQQFNQGVTKAGLTGYYDDTADVRQQMADNSAAWANASPEEQQRLHNENLQLASSIGATYDDKTGEYAFKPATRTLQGQSQDLNNAQVMGQLTGKLPDGTPTNAEQQRQLENAWKAADNLGVIGEQLGSLYNLPANTPTLQAKQIAAQLSISQQNANTSASNAANSNSLAREKLDWEKSQQPQSKTTDYKMNPDFAQDMQYLLNNKETGATKLTQNAQMFIQKYGYDGYQALVNATK